MWNGLLEIRDMVMTGGSDLKILMSVTRVPVLEETSYMKIVKVPASRPPSFTHFYLAYLAGYNTISRKLNHVNEHTNPLYPIHVHTY